MLITSREKSSSLSSNRRPDRLPLDSPSRLNHRSRQSVQTNRWQAQDTHGKAPSPHSRQALGRTHCPLCFLPEELYKPQHRKVESKQRATVLMGRKKP